MNKSGLKNGAVWGILILGLILVVGCSPAMRKKFIRQNDNKEEDVIIPVLEPLEYENELQSVKTRYHYFYALLKVWLKDAVALVDDHVSDKQVVYTISQITLQLSELSNMLTGASRQTALDGISSVEKILAYYDQPASFRNKDIVRRSLQRLTESVVRPLEYDLVKGDLNE